MAENDGTSATGSTTATTAPTHTQQQPPRAPDTRGHSPALDRREQAGAGDQDRKITIGGMERPEREVLDILADHSQRQIAKAGLPSSPDAYEVRLPDGFKAPEGMEFQINANDPALKQFREMAHRRGLDSATFQDLLGLYASTKVGELQNVNNARAAELAKLGAAAPQRIDAIETWLTAKVGDKAKVMIATLKQFPVAANVEALEGIIRAFSSQGGSTITGSHREHADPKGAIPGYDNMSFAQKRAAQMNQRFGGRGGDR
ncbi:MULTISPECIES: hypothetical protein [unclassified Bradyrhizobium]